VKEGWASLGFGHMDDYDGEVETTESFGGNAPFTSEPMFNYQMKDTFYSKGGYLE
jgi:hypothetical protein